MKKLTQGSILLLGLLAVLPGGVQAATEGRISGSVVDPDGNPIADAKISVTGREVEYLNEATTNAKGKFTMVILDGTRGYDLRIEVPGYLAHQEPLELKLGGVLRREWILYPEGSSGPTEEEMARIEARNKVARLYNEGAELFDKGDLKAALVSMEAALAESPDLPLALAAKARIHLDLAEQASDPEKAAHYESSLAAARRLGELVPEEAFALQSVFDALWGLGRTEEAEETLVQLAELAPGPQTALRQFDVAVRATKSNDLEKAKTFFTRSAESHPQLKEAYLNLGLIAQAEGEVDAAVGYADRYLELDANNPRALRLRYEVLQEAGRKSEADEAFTALKSADPSGVARSFLDSGIEVWNAGETERAKSYFERVLEIMPDHPRAHYQLGLCYASGGEPARAKQLLQRFLALAPDDPEAETARMMLDSL